MVEAEEYSFLSSFSNIRELQSNGTSKEHHMVEAEEYSFLSSSSSANELQMNKVYHSPSSKKYHSEGQDVYHSNSQRAVLSLFALDCVS